MPGGTSIKEYVMLGENLASFNDIEDKNNNKSRAKQAFFSYTI
jgi:hypothetical protein